MSVYLVECNDCLFPLKIVTLQVAVTGWCESVDEEIACRVPKRFTPLTWTLKL